ncbi:MAG: Ig-like domain-containing protein [Pirellulales bacterium]
MKTSRILPRRMAVRRREETGRRIDRGIRRLARRLTGEALEPRLVLAVLAAADSYTTAEDIGFTTDATAVVARRSQGGWTIFDDLPRTGGNANMYPDANQSPVRWFERGYDAAQPSFAAWEGAGEQGLGAPFAFDIVTVLAPATQVDAPASLKTTVLARKTFSLSQAQADATAMTLDYVCDDGCVVYLNDVEVLRVNMPAGPIGPNTFATAGGLETAYTSVPIDLTLLGVELYADATNVLAIEVHNDDPQSSDIGFDVSLSVAGGQGGTRANDTIDQAVAPVNTYYWDGIANPATTTATTGPVFAADGVTQVGTVSIVPATGEFRYTPVTSGLGVNYSGNATFRYVLRDNDIAGAASTTTVTIAISAVNDPPVANDDVYAVVRGTGPLVIGTAAGNAYVSPGSAWFHSEVLVDQDDLNPEWRGPASGGFDPGSGSEPFWSTVPGAAPLGFGNGNEVTTLTIDTVNPPVTYYFQRTFNVFGAIPSLLRLGLMADDCAAVYINGVEVTRSPSLPYGQGFVTFCSGSVDGLAEQRFVEAAIPTDGLNLQSIGNTIAVEVHQVTQTSNDVSFDLWLRSGLAGLRANDADPDDPASELLIEVVDQSQFTPGVGTLSVQGDGSLNFMPAGPNVVGTYSFTYRALNNGQPTPPAAASRVATATITILATPQDRPPGAVEDFYEIDEDTVLEVTRSLPLIGFGDTWSYFDDMRNGRQSNPNVAAETYPLDSTADADATPGVAHPWFGEAFDTATSNPAIGTWKTGRGIFAAPLRGLRYGPGTTLLGGIGNAALPAGENTVDTYLFRRTFVVDDPASVQQLFFFTLIDDGAVIYINGEIIGGIRMPGGAITSTTLSNGNGVEDDYEWYILTVQPGLLHNGVNTIAFEVHQNARTSSDVGFDLSLSIAPGAGVLSNDVDPDGDPLGSVRVVREPANGAVVMNGDGTFQYTPNANYNGVDSFDYVTASNGRDSAPATVSVLVNSIDDPPDAIDDEYSTPNTATLIVDSAFGVLVNDIGEGTRIVRVDLSGGAVIDHEAGQFTWTNVSGTESDGSFTFEPTPGFVGMFVLAYSMQDGFGLRDTALLKIEVVAGSAAEDLDGDGDVDLADLATLVAYFGSTTASGSEGDLDADGSVGVADAIRLRNALSPPSPSPAAVVRSAQAPQPRGIDAVMRSAGETQLAAVPRRARRRAIRSVNDSHASTPPAIDDRAAKSGESSLRGGRTSRGESQARKRRG